MKYIAPLKEKLGELQTQVEDPELVRLCLLEWRLTKEAAHKRKENSLETCQKQLLQWKEEVVRQARKMVRWLLGQVVRASSLVETINSWLRPFSGKASVTHRTMAAQGKWTGNLQFAQAVLEYPSV